MSSSIWAFLLGPISGPRRMLVQAEDDGFVGIKADQNIFKPNTPIESTTVTINEKLYRVQFDITLHLSNRRIANYIFLRLLKPDLAIDICVKNDLPDIIDCLTTYVLFLFFLHCPTLEQDRTSLACYNSRLYSIPPLSSQFSSLPSRTEA